MNARTISALFAVLAFGLSVAVLTHCELAVDLDRSAVDGAVPDGCAICTPLGDAGEEGGEDAATDGASTQDGASTADAGDATPGQGGPDGAPDAAGGG